MDQAIQPLSSNACADLLNVSRETIEKIEIYINLLRTWQTNINLVGNSTLEDPWRRHILDSAQLIRYLPPAKRSIVDIGSGAGFPGLVLAILTDHDVQLVESNSRKCAFLREAARHTGATVEIHQARIESFSPVAKPNVITARACAPLDKLLGYTQELCGPETMCLFLKGRQLDEELTESKKMWDISYSIEESISDSSGVVLKIGAFSQRHEH